MSYTLVIIPRRTPFFIPVYSRKGLRCTMHNDPHCNRVTCKVFR
jgi:hypothetical protein